MNTKFMAALSNTSDLSRFQFWMLVGLLTLLSALSAVPAAILASGVGMILMLRYGLGYANGPARLVWPLVAVFVLGLLHADQNAARDISRDVIFAFNPLALLFAGYFLSSRLAANGRLINVIVCAGIISAAIHLSAFLVSPGLLLESAQDIRDQAGSGDAIVGVALVLLWHSKRLACFCPWRTDPGRFYPAFVLLLMSLVLSFSRTDLVTVVLLMLAMSGYIGRFKWRTILKLGFVTALCSLFFLLGPNVQAEDGFLAKIGNSFAEMAIADYTSAQDINANWRGFEAFQAVAGFLKASTFEQITGRGFGALVDLGFYMDLGGAERRYIPWLHNGYAYVLTKFGVLGILLYGYFYFRMVRIGSKYGHHEDLAVRFFSRTLVGSIISLAAITLVIGGIPVAAAPVLVMLVGYSVGMLRRSLGIKRRRL